MKRTDQGMPKGREIPQFLFQNNESNLSNRLSDVRDEKRQSEWMQNTNKNKYLQEYYKQSFSGETSHIRNDRGSRFYESRWTNNPENT